MSRGLSTLQKTILRMAYVNYAVGLRAADNRDVDVYFHEVLAAFWGWQPASPLRDHTGQFRPGQHFSRDAIGAERYNAAHASLSRAVVRLERRGLVTAHRGYVKWRGIRLTPAGFDAAKDLKQAG